MKILRRILFGAGALVIVLYVAALTFLYVMQREYLYLPRGAVLALSKTGLSGAEAVAIPTADGAVINGWYDAPKAGKPVIVYYHGVAENFTGEYPRYEAFAADGYGFLAFDSRGYPASPGELTQQHVLADGLAAYDWAKAKGAPVVIWGRSLGSAPAVYVASQRHVDALFLESPLDSTLAVARDNFWFFPIDLLMKDKFPVDEWITKATGPVFVAHGKADRTIRSTHGQRVYDLAPNKAGIWIPARVGHDLWKAGAWERAKAFFTAEERA